MILTIFEKTYENIDDVSDADLDKLSNASISSIPLKLEENTINNYWKTKTKLNVKDFYSFVKNNKGKVKIKDLIKLDDSYYLYNLSYLLLVNGEGKQIIKDPSYFPQTSNGKTKLKSEIEEKHYLFTYEYDNEWEWAKDYDFLRFENVNIDKLNVHPDFAINEEDVKNNSPRVRKGTLYYYAEETTEMKPFITDENYNMIDGHHRLYSVIKKKQEDIRIAIVRPKENYELKARGRSPNSPRSPKGGTIINGKYYQGGQFIPVGVFYTEGRQINKENDNQLSMTEIENKILKGIEKHNSFDEIIEKHKEIDKKQLEKAILNLVDDEKVDVAGGTSQNQIADKYGRVFRRKLKTDVIFKELRDNVRPVDKSHTLSGGNIVHVSNYVDYLKDQGLTQNEVEDTLWNLQDENKISIQLGSSPKGRKGIRSRFSDTKFDWVTFKDEDGGIDEEWSKKNTNLKSAGADEKDEVTTRQINIYDLNDVMDITQKSLEGNFTQKYFSNLISLHRKTSIVAELDDNVVGYVIVKTEEPKKGHVISIAVDPEYRGKGIGKKLMNVVSDNLSNLGAKQISLMVRKSNEPAINMYEGLNYIKTGSIKSYYRSNGEDAVVMNLSLLNHDISTKSTVFVEEEHLRDELGQFTKQEYKPESQAMKELIKVLGETAFAFGKDIKLLEDLIPYQYEVTKNNVENSVDVFGELSFTILDLDRKYEMAKLPSERRKINNLMIDYTESRMKMMGDLEKIMIKMDVSTKADDYWTKFEEYKNLKLPTLKELKQREIDLKTEELKKEETKDKYSIKSWQQNRIKNV